MRRVAPFQIWNYVCPQIDRTDRSRAVDRKLAVPCRRLLTSSRSINGQVCDGVSLHQPSPLRQSSHSAVLHCTTPVLVGSGATSSLLRRLRLSANRRCLPHIVSSNCHFKHLPVTLAKIDEPPVPVWHKHLKIAGARFRRKSVSDGFFDQLVGFSSQPVVRDPVDLSRYYWQWWIFGFSC